MRAWDLLTLLDGALIPKDTKIHLAVENKDTGVHPLDKYRAGKFQKWQAGQSRRNFERPNVVALIELEERHQWMFAGAYSSKGCGDQDRDGWYTYRLSERQACRELDGKLVVTFVRPGRQSYLNAESWIDHITLSQITTEALSVPEFPGFKGLHISKHLLDAVVRTNHGPWKTALSSVAGVYLIADPESGKFYVGSATGEGGIWQRWMSYSKSGHGGNRDLRKLLESMDTARRDELHFSILEIADTHTTIEEIRSRESHWKQVLLTRIHGLNAN
jgi:hypothetical protein